MTAELARHDSAPGPGSLGRASTPKTTLLVVDDALVDRHLAGGIVEECLGWRVVYADNGLTALAAMKQERPSLVLTDLQMPGMDGLQLVAAIGNQHPLVPVVLMTAHGSEEVALQALRRGAASYVPKKCLAGALCETLEQVLEAAQANYHDQRLAEGVLHREARYLLENDMALVRALVARMQRELAGMKVGEASGRVHTSIALHEALTNALYHGNLELDSDLREQDQDTYWKLAEERCAQPPYRDRRIHVTARLSRSEVVYVVRDQGPGFDRSLLPDPTDLANLERPSGRGLLLIRTFMDEVHFNEAGNEITVVKRWAPAAGQGEGEAPRPPEV